MAADLHIHVLDNGATREDVINMHRSIIGSKHFSMSSLAQDPIETYRKVGETSSIWIGEVSWLKAGLYEDAESYVPDTVAQVQEIIGEDFPVIDDEMISKVEEAFAVDNATRYSLAEAKRVVDWLRERKGLEAFTVSW